MKHYLKIVLVALLLVSSSTIILSQPSYLKSTKTETIKGKLFYIHTVEKGQTLYGISKIYSISVDEILEYNSDASLGIKKGMELKILSKTLVSVIQPPNIQSDIDTSFLEHTVKIGETLYSISKLYNISVAQLKSKNPNIQENLAIGAIIRVPTLKKKVELTVKNSDIVDKINQGVPVENEIKSADTTSKVVEPIKISKTFRGYYEVALIMPLYLSEAGDAAAENIKSLKDLNSIKSFSFIQFYESFLIALHQFEDKGVKVTLRVYDVVNDTNKLNRILNSADFKNVDLVVGPFFTNTYKVAARWAAQNQVFIVNPFSNRNDLFKNNPFTIKMTPSNQDEASKIVQYCNLKFSNANVLLLSNGTDLEKKFASTIKQQFLNSNSKFSVREVIYSENGINGVSEKLENNRDNILITLFTKEALVTNFVRRLYELKRDNITLFGSIEWMEYDNIETDYLEYLNLHYYNTYFVDYKDKNVIKFVEKFRNDYNTEPELAKYAFQGYDICAYFVGALIKYGYSWNEKIGEYHPELLSSKVTLVRKDDNCGFENSEIQIFKLKDYRYIRAE
ncbi:MAG: LysM peptidoglycan-binding domain-containing protein [Bacteroidota bacterium]